MGVGVCRAGGREASAVLHQVAVPCLWPTDAACRFQLRETQMAVRRLSEKSTLARQQTRRRLGRAVTQLASVGCLRRGLGERHVLGSRGSTRRLHIGLLLGVCSWWRCSRGSCIPRQADRTRDHYQTSSHRHFFGGCGRLGLRCSNLHAAAVALLPWLHEGISTDRPLKDAIGGGGVQQTGGVDLL